MTDPAGDGPETGIGEQQERNQVQALVAKAVRARFALDVVGFADCVRELARAACRGSDRSLLEHVERLSLDDLYLATACARGDEGAWEEFGRDYFGFIRGFARRFLPDHEAKDLADQVIADLWSRRKLGRFEGRSTLRTWLGAVVAHAALNAGKALRRTLPSDGDELRDRLGAGLSSASDAAAEDAAERLRRIVEEAIAALPPEDKLLLRLYYEQGLTLDEMSFALRVSKAALSRRLKRTREALRDSIELLSQRSAGVAADLLRTGLDLSRVELDLGVLLGESPALERRRRGAV